MALLSCRNILVLCTILACLVGGTLSCPGYFWKSIATKPDDVVQSPGCYLVENMFIEGASGTSTDLILELNSQRCIEYCKDKKYMGKLVVLHRNICHCNKAFKRRDIRDDSNCDFKCTGDANEMCGGGANFEYASAYKTE